ncbi:unnamed protein product [Prunus armeniaca]
MGVPNQDSNANPPLVWILGCIHINLDKSGGRGVPKMFLVAIREGGRLSLMSTIIKGAKEFIDGN